MPALRAGPSRAPSTQAEMTKSLLRPCLGCSRLVRGRTRCTDCKRDLDRPKDQAKRARRPELKTYRETERRRRAVAEHRATIGDWCPGVPELGRGAHPAANLSADHVIEVGRGGREDGPLVVRCIPCNAARSASLARRVAAELGVSPLEALPATPLPAARPITLGDGDDPPPPVVA